MSIELSNDTVEGRITLVVPTRNSARTIDACCASIRRQTDADVELIVVDNDSNDDTVEIASRWADKLFDCGPERSAQRNLGLWHATGEFVAFIDSDMVLERPVASEIAERFGADDQLGALVLPERAFGQGRWIGARILEKELSLGDPAVEAARAFRTIDVAAAGGYDESVTGREDWDLPDRMVDLGWTVGRVDATVWHDEGDISARELFHKKRYYGRGSAAHTPSALRSSGWGRSRRIASGVATNPIDGLALVALKSVEAAGFSVGRLAFG